MVEEKKAAKKSETVERRGNIAEIRIGVGDTVVYLDVDGSSRVSGTVVAINSDRPFIRVRNPYDNIVVVRVDDVIGVDPNLKQ